ncbi:hypothetical protein Tco_1310238 [Tanacetum coccineum]
MAMNSQKKAMLDKRRKPLVEIRSWRPSVTKGISMEGSGTICCVHDTFHVSNLKKCLAEPDVQVIWIEIEIDENFVLLMNL